MISLLFSAIKYATSYFSTDESTIDEINDINTALSILETAKEHDPISNETEVLGESCYYKTGVVTIINSDYILIDDRSMCERSNVFVDDLKIGDKVYYLAYKNGSNQEEKICKIIDVINDIWEQDDVDSKESAKSGVFKRNIVGKVNKREGRKVFVEPNDVRFSLDNVRSNFVPMVGDWIKLECLVELNENSADFSGEILQVDNVQPLRSKLDVGCITNYNSDKEIGIIDKNIIFSKNVCEAGYIPCVGDKVVSDSIESEQDFYTWRSLTIVPLEKVSGTVPSNSHSPFFTKNNLSEGNNPLFKDKFGITITKDIRINLDVNNQQEISVIVRNTSSTPHVLQKTYFTSRKAQSQLTLLQPDVRTVTVLEPMDEVSYKFNCCAKNVGVSEEVFVFRFNNFEIGRIFHITVNPKSLTTKSRSAVGGPATKFVFDKEQLDDGVYIPGIKPLKPAQFIKVRNGVFRVPRHYWDAVLVPQNYEGSKATYELAVADKIPCLLKELRFDTYKDRFHALLYLEEIATVMELQRYDIDITALKRRGEYLSLEVPGLAEKRPSLLVGDRAIVSFRWDSSEGKTKYEGFVHKVSSGEVFLKFNQKFHEMYNGEDCQVSFRGSTSVFQRCHNAINTAIVRLGVDFLFPTRIVEKTPQLNLEEDENAHETTSRQPCHKRNISNTSTSSNTTTATSSSDTSSGHSRSSTRITVVERLFSVKPIERFANTEKDPVITEKSWHKQSNTANSPTEMESYINQIRKRKLIWYNKKLNHCQKAAVRNVLLGLARPLPYVIYGPPGTGKTITLCETILQILTTIPESRLLIATPSNSSANLIAERLLDSNVLKPGDLVRLIAHHCLDNDSIPARLLPYCATGELAAEGTRTRTEHFGPGPKINCTMKMLGRHRITVGTCTALGLLHNMGFPRGHFSHVIIDEAGQATEPEIMIPLNFIHSDYGQVVLAGDPMQLGPVVQSKLADHYGYGESFLSRLLHYFPYQKDPEGFETGYDARVVTKLVVNYRSLPEILELPNSMFYDSELVSKVSSKKSEEVKLLQSLAKELPERNGLPPAIIFHGINGENYRDQDSPSWYNPAEATQVYFYLSKLYTYGLTADDIGIITPYQKQVIQIRDLLLELDVDPPKVSSVEGFQGQERKIIILSTVRSSNKFIDEDIKHSLGFVASPRRMNVAITRARALLIILGNPWLLSQDTYWRNVLTYCIDRHAYTGCDFLPSETE